MIKLDKNGLTAPTITTGSITMDDTSVESFDQFVIKNKDGVIEGGINVDTGILISGNINSKLSDENKNLDIGWKYDEREGAVLSLSSIEETDNPGGFNLTARNDNKSCTLKGTTSGNLTWNDCLLFETPYNSTSWNGICVAALGNHSDFSIGFEAKHGGVLQFNHTDARTDDENGAFYLSASDSDGNLKTLCGKKSGTLTWAGSKVITISDFTDFASSISFSDSSTERWIGFQESRNGSRLFFFTNNNENYSGHFRLVTGPNSSGNRLSLTGTPDGSLTWNNSNIVTYSLLSKLDTNIAWTTNNSRAYASVGFNSSDGARLGFYSKNHTSWAGYFQLTASDGSTNVSLVGKPDGSLTWDGQAIITNYNKTHIYFDPNLATSRDIGFSTGNNNTKRGAYMTFKAGGDTSAPGQFTITARDANNAVTLAGKPDGTLSWGGKIIPTHLNATDYNPIFTPGCIIGMLADTTPKGGWLICQGQEVSRTTYANLFAAIGTTYGAGNGSTTFNLPQTTNRVLMGSWSSEFSKERAAGLPNITGSFHTRAGSTTSGTSGAIYGGYGVIKYTRNGTGSTSSNATVALGAASTVSGDLVDFDASRASSIYGNSSTVQPPALMMRWYIKY